MRTDGQTFTKQSVAFRNIANAPKETFTSSKERAHPSIELYPMNLPKI